MWIETERMILRDFAANDFEDLHEIFSDPIVMEHTEPEGLRAGDLRGRMDFQQGLF